jgi:hypothetical protein
MAKQDEARQPLTPIERRYVRLVIILLIATVIVIAGFFAMTPLLGSPTRIDDLLAMIAGFVMLQGVVIMTALFTIVPRYPDLPRRRLSHVLAAATGGAALLLPIVGQGWIDPRLNFAIVLVLAAACCWFAWRIWRVSDELDRTIMKETYAVSCLIFFLVFWVYATGERLGLLGGVTAWGVLAFATLVDIPISIWVAVRHGGMVETPEDEQSP